MVIDSQYANWEALFPTLYVLYVACCFISPTAVNNRNHFYPLWGVDYL